MSIIKDLNEFHISIKSFALSILFIMPFWYMDIFLFHREFFVHYPFYIPIVFSFCLSTVGFVPSFWGATQLLEQSEIVTRKDRSETPEKVPVRFGMGAVVYVLILAGATCVCFHYKWNIYRFLYIVTGLLIVFYLFTYGLLRIAKNVEKKNARP